jgi:hypothetical protein
MAALPSGDDGATDAWRVAEPYLKRYFSATPNQRSRLLKKAPLGDIQASALRHRDASIRRVCLFFLDHHANEVSTAVFAAALHDPAGHVRTMALHSIACESCRTDELCASVVVADIAAVLETDPDPELRTKAMTTLLRLADRDSRATDAIRRAAEHDPDPIVRTAAAGALSGSFVAPRKRYDRQQRRHGGTARRVRT